jgi:hypothetical protein
MNRERDDFIKFIKDPLNHGNVNQNNGHVCAMVSLFYHKTREFQETVNIRVSDET